MSVIRFRLFGKFSIERDARQIESLDASKERELLSYLLINRHRPHPRETLASLLWGETSTEKSKKYLRQALWHLQNVLASDRPDGTPVLLVEHDWVRVDLDSEFWLDVAEFEQAFALTQGVSGKELDPQSVEAVETAVQLYTGDLLEGCYQDWCLYERERLQNAYLLMLDKLISYCEAHGKYEKGMFYGATILRYDRARESTYRQLMRLHYMADDRTGALRQYERCVAALAEELGVAPDQRTKSLYERIREDKIRETDPPVNYPALHTPFASLPELLARLKELHAILADTQRRVQRDIRAVELGIKAQRQ